MLKTQLASQLFLAPSRVRPANVHCVLRTPLTTRASHSLPANMTAEATAPKGGQQPMLASQRAKQQQEQTREPPRKGFSYFPLGYKDAVHQWWTSVSSAVAEKNVLSYVPYLKEATSGSSTSLAEGDKADPHGPRVWRTQLVHLSGKNRALNEYSVERVGEEVDDTLVMLHGYGAGLGFFYKNFEHLSRTKGWRIYALDMLGMGNSSRPPFKIHAKDAKGKITEAENWFADSLEEWRATRGIEKMSLLGHSLGGYLAVSYALKYPGRINKLILASPVGIPEDPYAVNDAMPEPEESALAHEFTDDQESIVSRTNSTASNFQNTRDKKGAVPAKPDRKPLAGWLVWLWDANVSPFSIVRASGPLGPRLVSGWTSRRFNHLPAEESQTLHTYAYTLFRQKGSGEYVLPYLLAPGAYARSPIINRIQEVGRQVINPATETTPEVKECGYPIVLMYGENDWMDVAGGLAAEEKLKQRIVKSLLNGTAEEKRREHGSAKVVIVPKAGHHLYLDNPDNFNKVMQKEMEETRAYGQKQKAMR